MKKYRFVNQRENMCIPSCIQSILELRRFYPPSQGEIGEALGFNGEGVLIEQNLEPLKSYLIGRGLDLSFYRPSNEIIEPDVFLRGGSDSQDIMVGFMYSQLYGEGENQSHFALMSDFQEGVEKEVFLHDNQRRKVEQVSLDRLVNSMKAETQCGFYLIG